MKFTNPNQFEKTRRLEGFRSHDDIWDIETHDKIKSKIENPPFRIRELLKEHELSFETKSCLYKTRAFCTDLSEDLRQTFLTSLEQHRNGRSKISPKVIDYLLDKSFDLPDLTIAHGKGAEGLLKEFNLNNKIGDQYLLLVFQLPKPLAQFWWKGRLGSCEDSSEDVHGSVIEWGYFYRELMPIVWREQGYYEDEYDLGFSRINKLGEHDPKKYYYVWKMFER